MEGKIEKCKLSIFNQLTHFSYPYKTNTEEVFYDLYVHLVAFSPYMYGQSFKCTLWFGLKYISSTLGKHFMGVGLHIHESLHCKDLLCLLSHKNS